MSKTWTSLSLNRGKCSIIRNLTQGMICLACGIMLSGCGPVSSLFDGNKDNASYQKSSASQPPQTGQETAGITPLSPPDAGIKPLLPGQSGTQYTAEGLPVLQPSHGVNLETLFAQDIRDPIERVKRVENAVIDIRQELDAITPSIVRLVAVEKDIQSLVEQLEVLLQNEPPQSMNTTQAAYPSGKQQVSPPPRTTNGQGLPESGTPSAAGMPMALTPQTVYTPPPEPPKARTSLIAASGINVREARLGEHKNKTRLVLDVSGPTSFRYDLDKTENLLIIELPQAGWTAATEWASKKAPLVASYSVQPMNGGSRVIIPLKHSADVIYSGSYAPNKDSQDYRIVLDIAAPAVHGR